MILIDTSVWADHFRVKDSIVLALLEQQQVLCHPFVIGELSLGNLGSRRSTLAELAALPGSAVAETGEVLNFVDREQLYGTGLGFVDVHLLVATLLTPGASLWTRDKRLQSAAGRFHIAVYRIQ